MKASVLQAVVKAQFEYRIGERSTYNFVRRGDTTGITVCDREEVFQLKWLV